MATDPALVVPARRFSVGLVLRDSLRVWFTTLPKLALTSIVVMAPWFGLLWLLVLAFKNDDGAGRERTQEEMRSSALLIGVFISFVVMLCLFAVQGAVVKLVFQKLRGERPSVVKTVQAAFRRLLPILGVVLTMSLVGLVSTFVILLLTRLSPFFTLLAIPLAILFVAWSIAIPATVVEALGPLSALARSGRLTRGSRWKVFFTWLVAGGAWFLVSQFATGVLEEIAPTASAGALGIRLALLATFGSFPSVVPAVIYHELRETKEGIGLDQLASVFQ